MVRKYGFAHLKLLIQSSFPFRENGFSPLFAADFDTADITYTLDTVESLSPSGKLLFSGGGATAALDESGSLVRYAYDQKDGEYYLALVSQGDNRYRASLREASLEPFADMFYLWNSLNLQHALLIKGRLFLHASFIETDKGAVLFCGASGVGKSTQAKLWQTHRAAQIINGDKAVVYASNAELYASGVPVAGTSGQCINRISKLRAIAVLAQGKENTVHRLSPAQAVAQLVSCAIFDSWSAHDRQKALLLAADFAEKALICSLECLPDESAVTALEAFMSKEV